MWIYIKAKAQDAPSLTMLLKKEFVSNLFLFIFLYVVHCSLSEINHHRDCHFNVRNRRLFSIKCCIFVAKYYYMLLYIVTKLKFKDCTDRQIFDTSCFSLLDPIFKIPTNIKLTQEWWSSFFYVQSISCYGCMMVITLCSFCVLQCVPSFCWWSRSNPTQRAWRRTWKL